MNALPEGWRKAKLAELGTFSKGSGITKSELVESGVPCIRYGEIYTKFNFKVRKFHSFVSEDEACKRKFIEDNDLLFAGSGETRDEIGKCVSFDLDEKACAGGDVIILSVDPAKVRADFASYYLNTLGRKQINALGQGDSIVHIYPNSLGKVEIRFPPLAEQKSIASLLETWDAAIEKTEALIAAKEKRFQWLLHELIGKRKADTRLGKVCELEKGERLRKNGDNLSYLEIGDVDIRLKTYDISKKEKQPVSGSVRVPENTLLISTVRPTRGAVTKTKSEIYVSSAFCKLKIKNDFIFYCVQQRRFFEYLKARQSGATYPTVKDRDVLAFKVPSLPEGAQQSIAETLNTAQCGIALLQILAAQCRTQKRGLIQQLLTGQWRTMS